LLSALALPDGTARRAFESVGADPDALREAILAQHQAALRSVGIDANDDARDVDIEIDLSPSRGPFQATAGCKSVFLAAGLLGRKSPGPFVGAHIVIAICRTEHGTAPRALRAMGVALPALESAAQAELG
jgi:Clp amino terminal domain, pathogenicity island component